MEILSAPTTQSTSSTRGKATVLIARVRTQAQPQAAGRWAAYCYITTVAKELPMDLSVGPYDPCPCGSGKKYKFCCAQISKNRHGKYPVGTVALYGPDDKTTTKIAAAVITHEGAEPILERWSKTDILNDARIIGQIKAFFATHGIKNMVVADRNLGCPHEEEIDYPLGADCPFCPFWAGKQGSARRDDELDDDLDEDHEEDDDDEEDEDGDGMAIGPFDELDRDYERNLILRVDRMDAIIGNLEASIEETQATLLGYLNANLALPCEVTGSENFAWEEGYVVGGRVPKEYRRLKQVQPSYTDTYQLLEISLSSASEWMLFDDDLVAHVRRVSDGKEFLLGLSELEATDAASKNYELLQDYAAWFVNSQ